MGRFSVTVTLSKSMPSFYIDYFSNQSFQPSFDIFDLKANVKEKLEFQMQTSENENQLYNCFQALCYQQSNGHPLLFNFYIPYGLYFLSFSHFLEIPCVCTCRTVAWWSDLTSPVVWSPLQDLSHPERPKLQRSLALREMNPVSSFPLFHSSANLCSPHCYSPLYHPLNIQPFLVAMFMVITHFRTKHVLRILSWSYDLFSPFNNDEWFRPTGTLKSNVCVCVFGGNTYALS